MGSLLFLIIKLSSFIGIIIVLKYIVGRYWSHKRMDMWKPYNGFFIITTMAFSLGAGQWKLLAVGNITALLRFCIIIINFTSSTYVHWIVVKYILPSWF